MEAILAQPHQQLELLEWLERHLGQDQLASLAQQAAVLLEVELQQQM